MTEQHPTEGLARAASEPVSPATPRPPQLDARWMRQRLSRLVALGFGSGLARMAPGTVATLWAWASFLVLDAFLGDFGWAVLLGLGVIGGAVACERTARELGRGDPSCVVWDEIVAFWAVLWVLQGTFGTQLGAFVLFRLFDIAKPGPVRWAERRVRGGWGILADDLVAGALVLLVFAVWRAL